MMEATTSSHLNSPLKVVGLSEHELSMLWTLLGPHTKSGSREEFSATLERLIASGAATLTMTHEHVEVTMPPLIVKVRRTGGNQT
jgi:hypothetical protein